MSRTQKMKKNAAKKRVKKYVDQLRDRGLLVRRAYIFGSYARGKVRKDSDIDVCIVSNDLGVINDEKSILLWRTAMDVDIRIEPVGYTTSEFRNNGIPLVYEIKKNGIKIV